MKIKLAILEKDQCYLQRIVTVFSTKYSDNFEIYSFTDENIAISTIKTGRIDVLVASDAFEIDVSSLPVFCAFAYLVDSSGIETIRDQYAICKFQKAELIYRQILSIYSEKAGSISGISIGNENTNIGIFTSVGGGAGASTMAASAACYFAQKGMKTLYLNLEKFGAADLFFSGVGQYDMSDIIFALKSKKSNLALKLESCVKQAGNGVFFYSQPKIALDMLELTSEEILRLVSELKVSGTYDYIIIDMDFSLDKETMSVYRKANSCVLVSDGSDISNTKLFRAINALSVLEKNAEYSLMNRISVAYNKFSNKSSKVLADIDVNSIGGVPRYEHASTEQIMQQISNMDLFSKLF